jgi:hypothetical protein
LHDEFNSSTPPLSHILHHNNSTKNAVLHNIHPNTPPTKHLILVSKLSTPQTKQVQNITDHYDYALIRLPPTTLCQTTTIALTKEIEALPTTYPPKPPATSTMALQE